MKVVCLERIRRMRSPYERMPYVPRTNKRYVDESPWDLCFPIQPGRPWARIGSNAHAEQVSAAHTSTQDVQVTSEEESALDTDTTPRASPAPQRELSVRATTPAPQIIQSETRVRFSEPPSSRRIPSWQIAVPSSSKQLESPQSRLRPAQRAVSVETPGHQVEKSFPHKLVKYGATMHCFRTSGGAMTTPSKQPTAVAYDVYLHQNGDTHHVWYASENGDWVPATFGMTHPIYPGYILHLSNDRWARWLLKKTVSTYHGRKTGESQSKPAR